MFSKFIRGLLVIVVALTFVADLVFIYQMKGFMNSSNTQDKWLNKFRTRQEQVMDTKSDKIGQVIDIEMRSSKEAAVVIVNGKKVLNGTLNDLIGFNVVVLNQFTGTTMAVRSFDTYSSTKQSFALMNFLKGVSDGRIICFVTKDESTNSLHPSVVPFFKSYGSRYIDVLDFRDNWAFVVRKIGQRSMVYAEGHQACGHCKWTERWPQPVILHTNVEAESESSVVMCPQWKNDLVTNRRRQFCYKYEGYGNICRCTEPTPLDIHPPPLPDGRTLNLPIAIMASNRPYYLVRMLKSLLKVQGLVLPKVTVFVDGFFPEPVAVANLFGIRVEQHKRVATIGRERISQHYKHSLTSVFERFSDAKHLVVLEEDLYMSVDILDYFSQLIPVMEKDKSIYCISAWNDQGYKHTANDPTMLYRIETMPGLGWILSRRLYKEELEAKWPSEGWDWDMWMRDGQQRKGRECIIPDVSRTYHFGARGLNVSPYMQELMLMKRAFNKKTNIKFRADLMFEANYEREINRLLSVAQVLDHTKSPCSDKDFIPASKGNIYIYYFQMNYWGDWKPWMKLAECLHIWDLDPRGFHKGLIRLWLKENQVLFIGYPVSPYSKYKPSQVAPLRFTKST